MRSMCFSVPLKVLGVNKQRAKLEGGLNVKLDDDMNVKKGQYVRVLGNVAVDALTVSQGLRVRRLIKSLNRPP